MTGKGLLHHHFWGEYRATIVLQFGSTRERNAALDAFPMFTAVRTITMNFHGGGKALKAAEQALKAAGANMKKVTSMRTSIDHGEPFTVSVGRGARAAHDGSVQPNLWEGDSN